MTVTRELLNGVLSDVRSVASLLRQNAGGGSQGAPAAGGEQVSPPGANTLDAAGDRLAAGMADDPNFGSGTSSSSSAAAGGANPAPAGVVGSIGAAPNPTDQSGTVAAAADVGSSPASSPVMQTVDPADLRRPAGASSSSSSPAQPPAGGSTASSNPSSAPVTPPDQSGTIAAAADVGAGAAGGTPAAAGNSSGSDVSAQLRSILERLDRDESRIAALEANPGAGAGGGAAAALEGAAAAAADVGRRS